MSKDMHIILKLVKYEYENSSDYLKVGLCRAAKNILNIEDNEKFKTYLVNNTKIFGIFKRNPIKWIWHLDKDRIKWLNKHIKKTQKI